MSRVPFKQTKFRHFFMNSQHNCNYQKEIISYVEILPRSDQTWDNSLFWSDEKYPKPTNHKIWVEAAQPYWWIKQISKLKLKKHTCGEGHPFQEFLKFILQCQSFPPLPSLFVWFLGVTNCHLEKGISLHFEEKFPKTWNSNIKHHRCHGKSLHFYSPEIGVLLPRPPRFFNLRDCRIESLANKGSWQQKRLEFCIPNIKSLCWCWELEILDTGDTSEKSPIKSHLGPVSCIFFCVCCFGWKVQQVTWHILVQLLHPYPPHQVLGEKIPGF